MSRSYKKNPGWTDHGKRTRFYKRQASKRVRRKKHFYFENLGTKKIHIRMYGSWDLCDVRSIEHGYNRKQYFKKQIEKLLTAQLRYDLWGRIYKDYSVEQIKVEARKNTVRAFLK